MEFPACNRNRAISALLQNKENAQRGTNLLEIMVVTTNKDWYVCVILLIM